MEVASLGSLPMFLMAWLSTSWRLGTQALGQPSNAVLRALRHRGRHKLP